MKCVAVLLVCVGAAFGQLVDSASPAPVDRNVKLQLTITPNRHQFRLGETITVRLSFSGRGRQRYQLNEAQYDRSGRMNYEHFTVTPAGGAVDPLASYFAEPMMSGGLTNFVLLSRKPWSIQLNLNEWVRFTTPGEYKLRVASERVAIVDPQSVSGTSPVTALSNEVTLKILPAEPAWQRDVYENAIATPKKCDGGNRG